MVAWMFPGEEWIDLPGPAEWWPDDYDINEAGFAFLTDVSGCEEAFKMILTKDEPEDGSYERILPSGTELRLLEDTATTRQGLKAFYRLGLGKH